MDAVFALFHMLLPMLLIIAGLAIIVKIFLVFNYRGVNLPAFVYSFFRIYNTNDRQSTRSKQRQLYMRLNNIINVYLYITAFVFILVLIVYRGEVLR